MNNPYSMVAPGEWRGELDLRNIQHLPSKKERTTPDTKFDFSATQNGILPFNFIVEYLNPDSLQIFLLNGSDKQLVESYRFKPNVLGAKDSIVIQFPIYDTEIKAYVQGGVMQGEWIVHYRDHYSIPFTAHLGKNFRFTDLPKPTELDFTGRWKVLITETDGSSFPAIGDFSQSGNTVTGTFETETGDYRFLQGDVIDNKLYLSTFDGAHAFLFEGELNKDGQLNGVFYSGKHYLAKWEAVRDDNYQLRDPLYITKTTTDKSSIFSGRSIDQAVISFDQDKYQGKVKLLQIMGTWCPNCYDETVFLQDWIKNHPQAQVEVVSMAYERYDNIAKNIHILKQYRDRMKIEWPIVYGGQYNVDKVNLPFIDSFSSYPTLIVFDKNNNIQRIFTGFNGPATRHYETFIREFDDIMTNLLTQ
ncbi:TlpA disulfide reductase family protein [Membranihabitans marinus]|uniref:TlpA disulfide reductase family protein n=1 Tax=Membranihabitans marinus TaxID=1227546 RepID=UPI001F1FB8AC|nr:TlpA disulfide reductase family protein [Membranihabitans marinus]